MPLGHVLEEVAESIWHFDGKFWRTAKALLLHPGQITADFLDGRRQRYVPPFRLYVFTSALFFITLSLYLAKVREEGDEEIDNIQMKTEAGRTTGVAYTLRKGPNAEAAKRQDTALASARKRIYLYHRSGIVLGAEQARLFEAKPRVARFAQLADTVNARLANLPPSIWALLADTAAQTLISKDTKANDDTLLLRKLAEGRLLVLRVPVIKGGIALDSAVLDTLVRKPSRLRNTFLARRGITGWMDKRMLLKAARNYEASQDGANALADPAFAQAATKAGSWAMLVLTPLAALLLFGLYRRQRPYYTQHLIHALHLHVAAFVGLMLLFTLPSYFGAGDDIAGWTTSIVFFAGLPLYIYLSMKRVYSQSWGRTLAKFGLAFAGYATLFFLLMVVVIAYGSLSY